MTEEEAKVEAALQGAACVLGGTIDTREALQLLAVIAPAYRKLEAEARRHRIFNDVLVKGMVMKAKAELEGIEAACVCCYCGHAHMRLVVREPLDGG